MRPVKVTRDKIVEAVVVDAGQAVGALDVLPHPALERGFDLRELVLGGLGVGGVEDALLDPILFEDVIDLRKGRVRASMRSSPAWRRYVPQSVEELATAANAWTLTDQLAISTV